MFTFHIISLLKICSCKQKKYIRNNIKKIRRENTINYKMIIYSYKQKKQGSTYDTIYRKYEDEEKEIIKQQIVRSM